VHVKQLGVAYVSTRIQQAEAIPAGESDLMES
jgi:hypothetical protein